MSSNMPRGAWAPPRIGIEHGILQWLRNAKWTTTKPSNIMLKRDSWSGDQNIMASAKTGVLLTVGDESYETYIGADDSFVTTSFELEAYADNEATYYNIIREVNRILWEHRRDEATLMGDIDFVDCIVTGSRDDSDVRRNLYMGTISGTIRTTSHI